VGVRWRKAVCGAPRSWRMAQNRCDAEGPASAGPLARPHHESSIRRARVPCHFFIAWCREPPAATVRHSDRRANIFGPPAGPRISAAAPVPKKEKRKNDRQAISTPSPHRGQVRDRAYYGVPLAGLESVRKAQRTSPYETRGRRSRSSSWDQGGGLARSRPPMGRLRRLMPESFLRLRGRALARPAKPHTSNTGIHPWGAVARAHRLAGPEPCRRPGRSPRLFEAHIEQGPILEARGQADRPSSRVRKWAALVQIHREPGGGAGPAPNPDEAGAHDAPWSAAARHESDGVNRRIRPRKERKKEEKPTPPLGLRQ